MRGLTVSLNRPPKNKTDYFYAARSVAESYRIGGVRPVQAMAIDPLYNTFHLALFDKEVQITRRELKQIVLDGIADNDCKVLKVGE